MKTNRKPLQDYRIWFWFDDPSEDICVEYYGSELPKKLIRQLETNMGWTYTCSHTIKKKFMKKKNKKGIT